MLRIRACKHLQAFRTMGLDRSINYIPSQECSGSNELNRMIIRLAEGRPRYGYRQMATLLRRLGNDVNPIRVHCIRRQEGFRVYRVNRKAKRPNPQHQKKRSDRAQSSMELGLCSRYDRVKKAVQGLEQD